MYFKAFYLDKMLKSGRVDTCLVGDTLWRIFVAFTLFVQALVANTLLGKTLRQQLEKNL